MSGVCFAADVETLKISSRGSVTGKIFLEIGECEFPSHEWNDFVVVIIEWWATALRKLLKETSSQELIDFMDGPYAVEIRSALPGKFVVRGLQGSNRNVEVAVGEVEAMSFIAQFIDCAQDVLDSCREKSFSTGDVETLQVSLNMLRKEYFGSRGAAYIF